MRTGGQGGMLSQVRDQVGRGLCRTPAEPGHASGGVETAAQQLRRPAGCASQRGLSFYELSNHTGPPQLRDDVAASNLYRRGDASV
jgi:hypothetical protein